MGVEYQKWVLKERFGTYELDPFDWR